MALSKCVAGLYRFQSLLTNSLTELNSIACMNTNVFNRGQVYDQHYQRSIEDAEKYWAEAAEKLVWHKPWNKVLDNSNPPFSKWFSGGEISHCYNCIDRHVQNGNGDQIALIHDSPITNTMKKYTYREFQKQVSYLAGALSQLGVTKGDRVMIYMPMVPQAVMAMLATVRLGAIHVVVFGGFASKELSVRIDHCKPKVIISASCGVEPSRVVNYKPMLDQAIERSRHKPKNTIILQRTNLEEADLIRERDLDWRDVISQERSHDCVPVDANHPLYLLYTSGTTGLPKAVVRPTGGHSVVLHWSMKAIYDSNPGEVFWSPSDLGWIVGHSYVCHAPLIHGNTTLIFEVFWAAADLGWAVGHSYGGYGQFLHGGISMLYEGKPVGTPDGSTFFRIIQDHKVASLFVAPTALRSIKNEDPDCNYGKKYDLSSLRIVFVAGERCDMDTAKWTQEAFGKKPVLDHWWQTETGHAITSSCVGLGNRLTPPAGSTGLPVPGWDLRVVNDDGVELPRGELGNLVAKLPLPLGTFLTLWEDEERFLNTYFQRFKGYYDTMDAGIQDKEGYISVMSRTDDVINVAGHRLSCGHLEEAISSLDDVVECAVVAKDDEVKGSIPFGFIVAKPNADLTDLLAKAIAIVRSEIGPVAAFRDAVFVSKLPKTRSGKTPRNTLQAISNQTTYKISPTIEDESVYPELEAAVARYLSDRVAK